MKRVLIVGLGVAGTAALSKLLGDSKAKSEVEVDVCEIKERPWTFLSCGELVPDPDFLSKYVPENIKTVLRESHKLIVENTVIVNKLNRLVLKILDREYEFRFRAYLIDKSRLIKTLCEKYLGYVRERVSCPIDYFFYIVDKSKIQVTFTGRAGHTCLYDYVIAADGFESCLYLASHRRFLIRRDYLSLTCTSFRAKIRDLDKDTVYIIVDPSIAPGGYAWIFPRDSDEANCGLGVHPNFSMSITVLVDKFLEKCKIGPRSSMIGKVLPLDGTIKPHTVFDGRVMYVGDAGGFVIPTCGAGINTAIYTGMAAAETVLESGRYEEKVRDLAQFIDWLAETRRPLDPLLIDRDCLERALRKVPSRLAATVAYYLMLGSTRPLHRLMYWATRLGLQMLRVRSRSELFQEY